MTESFMGTWKEIIRGFLKIGATAYGGPAMIGILQAEFQERRQWVSKARFLEGMALVNVLPGATAVQLAIFLGYARGGWWGGLLGGCCFALPGFVVMLALTLAYGALGMTPVLRAALYGLGPVVLAIFFAAVYRLGRSALRSWTHALIAVGAAAVTLLSPVGVATILLAAGGTGLFVFHSRRAGTIVLVTLAVMFGLLSLVAWSPLALLTSGASAPTIGHAAALFTGIGTFTFGGGLSLLALVQEHVVDRLHWLTPSEFIDGLALGQLTPGPFLMITAYVGYKALGITGALVAATALFLPAFVMMLTLLPLFDRIRDLAWARAAMQGVVPAVLGVMAVVLARLAPHAAPDAPAIVVLVVASVVFVAWRVAPLKSITGGAMFGILRNRVLVWVR
jgi:chromate transporter